MELNEHKTFVRRPHDKVEVLNIDEICFPENVKVENLNELKPLFDALIEAVKQSMNVTVAAPEVTVNTPEVKFPEIPQSIVNVPAPIVNVPSINLDEVISQLSVGLQKLRHNNMSNPMFVRITDLDRILAALTSVQQATKEVMLGFPGSIRVQNAGGGAVDFGQLGLSAPTTVGSGKTTVTTAATRVVLSSSQSVKSLTIKAISTNTGTIYVGDSSVSSSNGFQLSAGDSVSLDISNLSTVYIDSSINTQSVSYMWVN